MTTKRCSRCREDKSLDQYASHPQRGHQACCKLCQRIVSRDWYANNKKRHKQNVRKNMAASVAHFNEWKQTLSCQQCGEKRTACLDFHHLDPTLKEFSLAGAARNLGKQKMMLELSKCVCLCSNCHRLVHTGEILLPPTINTVNIDYLAIV